MTHSPFEFGAALEAPDPQPSTKETGVPMAEPVVTPTPAVSLGIAGEIKALVARGLAWEKANQRAIAAALVFAFSHPDKVRAGVVGIISNVMLMFGLSGCASLGVLTPGSQKALTHVECVAHALGPVLSADAAQAAQALEDGVVTLPEVLAEVKATEELVKAIKADVKACDAPVN